MATTLDASARPDPLDPVSAPFGTYAPSSSLAQIRGLVINRSWPGPVRRWLYKSFTHFTKQRGLIADVEYEGMKHRLFVDENGHDRWIFRRGEHPEEDDLAIFAPYKGKDVTFIDIGGNVGYFALRAHRELGAGARILTFEPHPRTRAKLQMNLGFNGADRVEVVPLALGEARARLKLSEKATDEGGNTLLDKPGPGVEVDVAPLHEVLEERGVETVDILKIDVEGYEDRVLAPFFKTAPERLWPKEMLLETTFGAVKANTWIHDLRAVLDACGYRTKTTTRDNDWLVRDGA